MALDDEAIIVRLADLRSDPPSAIDMVHKLIQDVRRAESSSASPSLADQIRAAEVVLANPPETGGETGERAEALAFLMGVIR